MGDSERWWVVETRLVYSTQYSSSTECSQGALSVFVGVGGEEVSQVCSVTCESRCEAACAGLKEVVTGTGRFALRCSAADGCRPLPASPLL